MKTNEEMLATFLKMINSSISVDKQGFGISQSMYTDSEGKTTLTAYDSAIPLGSPNNPFWHVINIADEGKSDYILLATDMVAQPNQGLEFNDFVLVCEFDRFRPPPYLTSQWRYGVINYDLSSNPVTVRDIDWDNEFWQKEAACYMKTFGPPFRVRVIKKDEMFDGREVNEMMG